MLMSKSRLEKFLYALYSLDSSNLPTPLSRIEELYKCWVIGEETPTFEPLSRVEKYLMAILGVYDVDSLPNPLSRVEVLLHKLAIGDDNLDDIKSFLSEHEELLAEIIRNGGAGGNIDIEYVLYSLSTEFNTLYNTAEKPVKSAILKGQTLKAITDGRFERTYTTRYPQGYQKDESVATFEDCGTYYKSTIKKLGTINVNGEDSPNRTNLPFCETITDNPIKIEEGKTYTLYIPRVDNSSYEKSLLFRDAGKAYSYTPIWSNQEYFVFTAIYDCTIFMIYQQFMIPESERGKTVSINVSKRAIIVEGDHRNEKIPPSIGMGLQSVKMPVLTTTGKNLFDIEKLEGLNVNIEMIPNGIRIKNSQFDITRCFATPFKENTQYTVSFKHTQIEGEGREGFRIYYTDGTESYIIPASNSSWVGSTLPNKTIKSVSLSFNNKGTSELTYIQLEEGSVATEYESFKSNILTVNEPVELRAIGGVKDELNPLTGKLTQRINERVFDGSEDEEWSKYTNNTNEYNTTDKTSVFVLRNLKDKKIGYGTSMCDRFTHAADGGAFKMETVKPFSYSDHNTLTTLYFDYGDNNSYTVNDFRQWLSQNPITVQYVLGEPIIKTVDLSAVDQDGNSTKLSTFNDITHVTLSSEALIPEAELEVAAKNEEVLSTLSLEMDDISTTQNDLQETSDTQSENVDSTMIATTEIYEELL